MISYSPLFETMKHKGVTSYNLIHKKGFSKATYYRIKNGTSTNTDTIDALCKLLDCKVSDIIEYIPE